MSEATNFSMIFINNSNMLATLENAGTGKLLLKQFAATQHEMMISKAASSGPLPDEWTGRTRRNRY